MRECNEGPLFSFPLHSSHFLCWSSKLLSFISTRLVIMEWNGMECRTLFSNFSRSGADLASAFAALNMAVATWVTTNVRTSSYLYLLPSSSLYLCLSLCLCVSISISLCSPFYSRSRSRLCPSTSTCSVLFCSFLLLCSSSLFEGRCEVQANE